MSEERYLCDGCGKRVPGPLFTIPGMGRVHEDWNRNMNRGAYDEPYEPEPCGPVRAEEEHLAYRGYLPRTKEDR